MKNIPMLCLAALFFCNAHGQPLTVDPGASLTIENGAQVDADGLTLIPSADFILSNVVLSKSATVVHPALNTYISRVYQFSNTSNAFSGSIQINYTDGAELNGIPESALTLNIHNGTNWAQYTAGTRDASNNYVLTNDLSGITLNELTLEEFICTEYRTVSSGLFDNAGIWEKRLNPADAWLPATEPPDSGTAVYIRHEINLAVDFTVANCPFNLEDNGASRLIINPKVTLNFNGGIDGNAYFNGRPVVVTSTADGTGAIGAMLSNSKTNGDNNVTVERYIPNTGRVWRLLSIPVTSSTKNIRDAWAAGRAPIATEAAAANEPANDGTLITGDNFTNASDANAAGFDWWTKTSSSIRKYVISGSSGSWPSNNGGTPDIINPKLDALDELGYMLFARGDRRLASTTGSGPTTLRPNGSLKTGTKTVPVADTLIAKFKLIGNPYASPIDFEDLMANSGNSTAIIANHFWEWDAGNGTNGGFDLIHQLGAGVWEKIPTPFQGSGSVVENIQHIQSSQAIIVEATASGGTLTINEEDKSNPSGSLPSVFAADDRARFYTNFSYDSTGSSTGAGLKLADGVLAVFGDGFTIGISDLADIRKVYNFVENFGLLRDNEDLSLEAHPPITADDTLFFALYGESTRNYALQFKSVNMQPGVTAFLQDNYLAKETAISTADSVITTYNFAVTSDVESGASDRFRVVFKPAPLPLTLTSAKAYQQNNGVQVDWKTVNEKGIKSYEVEKSVDGRSFSKATSVAAIGGAENNYGWFDAAPFNGNNYYRIKLIGTDGKISYSAVLKLTTHHSSLTTFAIYPNPVKGSTINLQLSNMEKGKYTMSVFNSTGQLVMNQIINHQGGSSTEEIKLTDNLAAGVYRVSLVNAKGTSLEQSIVVQR